MSLLALGVDFGTSGLRLALVDRLGALEAQFSAPYPAPFEDPRGWLDGLTGLLGEVSWGLRRRIGALAIDGTSGTLLACRRDGALLEGNLARALPYHLACEDQKPAVADLLSSEGEELHCRSCPAASASGSLARALRLVERVREEGLRLDDILLRHQADWLMGWILGDWLWGEEGNNLRLGWDIRRRRWLGDLLHQPWGHALPRIRPSGELVGTVGSTAAARLGLPRACRVVTGTTDANACVLAARPGPDDGIAVLGTTLVLKQFVACPLNGAGISNHRVGGQWLVGGASNSGPGILRRFFEDREIEELSRQIDPDRPTGLRLRPLLGRGERFPEDDPLLMPVLGPRPGSDALYLQALLEGITAIESRGWRRLQELGAPPVGRVITLGGGARNPTWRTLRERSLGVPVVNRPNLTAAIGMAQLAGRHLPPSGGGIEREPHSRGGRMEGSPSSPP